ncbi:hypothetical protein Y032_0088g2199 [Ancylostoma ceylanicum]|uniref:Uncharacterized protein n=1 Tax=Ancylostoma ceylanicum TaxID=53326 RepID=A0A016TNZ0_9BILA|nr:hypothetical protein Y032_0088g2199 [Ancylostoma ceylanicum]
MLNINVPCSPSLVTGRLQYLAVARDNRPELSLQLPSLTLENAECESNGRQRCGGASEILVVEVVTHYTAATSSAANSFTLGIVDKPQTPQTPFTSETSGSLLSHLWRRVHRCYKGVPAPEVGGNTAAIRVRQRPKWGGKGPPL